MKMSRQRKERRQIQSQIRSLQEELLSTQAQSDAELRSRINQKLQFAKRRWKIFESEGLTNEAYRLGIEIPNRKDWWFDDYDEQIEAGVPSELLDEVGSQWLSSTGRLMVTSLIRKERRLNIEWWIKVITPLLAALISLLGLVVALVTVSRRS